MTHKNVFFLIDAEIIQNSITSSEQPRGKLMISSMKLKYLLIRKIIDGIDVKSLFFFFLLNPSPIENKSQT